jgi:hypothetical protein
MTVSIQHTFRRVCPRENPLYPLTVGSVGPRDGLDLSENRKLSASDGNQTLDLPGRSPTQVPSLNEATQPLILR